MSKDFSWEQLYAQAHSWVMEAGSRLRESTEEILQVEYKTSLADLVTKQDREIENFFIEKIKSHYPGHYVLGEEGMADQEEFDPKYETVWVIDPIDGTMNFVHQRQNYCISLAVYEQGQGRLGIIYDPVLDQCFHALHQQGAYLNKRKLTPLRPVQVEEALVGISGLWLTPNNVLDHQLLQQMVIHVRGTRSMGSAALDLAYVACGKLDGYLSLNLSPWDFAAGLVILEEVGAKMTTVHNQEIDRFSKSSIYVAKPTLHEQLWEKFMHPPQ